MEHKFGVFDTVEELNRAAAAQMAEGDNEALFALAAENGIGQEDVEDYLKGYADELATPLMAALGKLEMEAAELQLQSQLSDWKDQIEAVIGELESLDGVLGQRITAHGKLGQGVYVTTFADGSVVYVNYGQTDAVLGDVTVPARGFVRKGDK